MTYHMSYNTYVTYVTDDMLNIIWVILYESYKISEVTEPSFEWADVMIFWNSIFLTNKELVCIRFMEIFHFIQ